MTAEEIIEQILSKHPEISREEILGKLEKEKKKAHGLIEDAILLRMVAAGFGVESSKEASAPTLSLQDLVSGLNDIAIVGRIVAVFPPKTFEGGKGGKVANLLIADRNGTLLVVLWNDKVDFIESCKIKVGDIVRFSHGYTRKGYSGNVELHLGDRGEIQINPINVKAEDYPTIKKFVTKIKAVTSMYKKRTVNVTGMVEGVFPVINFERKDSNSGKVMRFILADASGKISVVVWNEKVDELEKKLKKGVKLQLVNAKVKKTKSEGFEIHVDARTYVEPLPSIEESLKIASLKESSSHVNIEGEVVTKPMLRNVKTSKGELVKLAVFELKDETGRIWVSAWRKHADTVSSLKVGDEVTIKNAYLKKGFGNKLEVSTKNATSMSFFPKQSTKKGENKTKE